MSGTYDELPRPVPVRPRKGNLKLWAEMDGDYLGWDSFSLRYGLVDGCGIYSFSGTSIQADVKTINIEPVVNNATKVNPSLANQLTEELNDKYRKLTRLEEKIEAQRFVKDLEKRRSEKRRSLFEAQDEVDAQKEKLFDEVEQALRQKKATEETLFNIRWRII